ncbi:MAG: hypothetical protein PVG39_20895 [Desulfobacteraceae bacterium]
MSISRGWGITSVLLRKGNRSRISYQTYDSEKVVGLVSKAQDACLGGIMNGVVTGRILDDVIDSMVHYNKDFELEEVKIDPKW